MTDFFLNDEGLKRTESNKMAIVFTLLSMLMTCGSDLFEKKAFIRAG